MATKKQARLDVKKTYKLFINGAFPRSESGRVFEVTAKNGDFLANPALASRKDLRDAVTAARAAQSGWSKATAYNRGQILYRIAEMLEGRANQFESEIALTSQITALKAKAEVLAAIDCWVWYAGWSDKLQAVSGATNPVSGPFFTSLSQSLKASLQSHRLQTSLTLLVRLLLQLFLEIQRLFLSPAHLLFQLCHLPKYWRQAICQQVLSIS
jgi:hypothetical protein